MAYSGDNVPSARKYYLLSVIAVVGLGCLVSALMFPAAEVYALVVATPAVLLAFVAYVIIRDRNHSLRQKVEHLNEVYSATVGSLAMAIDAKDQSTHGHVYRVRAVALKLAEYLQLQDDKDFQALSTAALLHDIGNLAIPEYILNKPSPLTQAEMLKLKAHSSIGADILQSVPFSCPVVPFVRHHHEKWDGTGYPAGLEGDEIPLGARILSVADAYDALRSDRPYRPRLPQELALDYVRAERGKSFDPAVADALVDHAAELEEFIKEAQAYAPRGVMEKLERTFDREESRDGQRVFEDIASTYRESQAIYEISDAVGKSLSTADTMQLLADKIGKLIGYDACAIFLVNPNQNRMVLHHAAGKNADLLSQVALRIGEGVSGWVAAHNLALANVSPMPDFPGRTQLESEFKSCLSVPLAVDDRVLGVITLYSGLDSGFGHDHLRLMESIAHHAGAAVNTAVMFEETQEDAYTDLLTGLPNLRYFSAFMDQELQRAARIRYSVTVLMMDLEGFKEINDKFGHKVGDRTLAEVAHVLRHQMRRSDMLVRYAGDEFVAVLPGTTKEQARQTIERIQAAVDNLRTPVRSDQYASVGISVGAAAYPEDGQDVDILLSLADQNMYSNKMMRANRRGGKSGILPFEKR